MRLTQTCAVAFMSLAMVGWTGTRSGEPCCNVVSKNASTRTVTAIERTSAKYFTFTVTSPATFAKVRLGDAFDVPPEKIKKDVAFAADLGGASGSTKPCCTMTSELGGPGQALGVHAHDATGVLVVLLELKRTSGNTVTAKWQYVNGSDEVLAFEQTGCVGMGCTYTVAEEAQFIDGATRTKFEVLRDDKNQAVAQRYEGSKLQVGGHQIMSTWAKFNAPSETSSRVTFIIPGVSEPFEDVPVGP